MLIDSFTRAPKLTNLTSALVLYFSKISPAHLNGSWTAEEQKSWLGELLLLNRRVKYRTGGAYLKELIEKVQEFIVQGTGANMLPRDFRSEMQMKLTAL